MMKEVMKETMGVQEMNDHELEQVVGGFSFGSLFSKVSKVASQALDTVSGYASQLKDVVKLVVDRGVRR